MEVIKSIEYFDKEKTEIMWRLITIIFDESNRITYRELYNQSCFMPRSLQANGNFFNYDDDNLLCKHGRGRIRKADLEKIKQLEEQAKSIIREMDF